MARGKQADALARLATPGLAPDQGVLLRHQFVVHLGVRAQPVEAAVDRIRMVCAAGGSQVEERHRRHGVLVHAVDGILLDDRSVARVVVPPPLAAVALQGAETVGASPGRAERFGVSHQGCMSRERLDGVRLIAETADVGPKPAERRRR